MNSSEIEASTISNKPEGSSKDAKNRQKNNSSFSAMKPWQKATLIVMGVVLVGGIGTAVTLDVINKNNSSNNSNFANVVDDKDDSFENAAKYTLELKDGENLINKAGVYTVTGSTSNGYIHVNAGDDKVKLILSNVNITYENGAAIYVESNGNVHIETVGENKLEAVPTEDIDATIYSKADLVFRGDGTLTIASTIDGIHGKDDVKIKSGTINVTADEDGIKGKDSLTIQGGTITISAGDDGLKASNDEEEDKGILTIAGGDVKITHSKEAIEAAQINIGGGNIDVTSTDDGINAAADFCSQMAMSPTGNSNITPCKLTIAGGTVKVNAGGDGLDANGSIYLSGGTVYVDGPSNSGNAALDYDGAFEITGGTIIATGMSGMATNASSATQGAALINTSTTNNAGSKIVFGDVEFTPSKNFNSIMVSSPSLEKGKSYDLQINGQTVQSVEFTDYIVGSGNGGMMGGGSMMGGQNGSMPNDGNRPEGDGSMPGDGERPDTNGEAPSGGQKGTMNGEKGQMKEKRQ